MSEYSGGSDIWLMEMVQKAQDQADARAESMMGSPVWDTLFTVAYQSTDEMDQSESIDPKTESEELPAFHLTVGDMPPNVSCCCHELSH